MTATLAIPLIVTLSGRAPSRLRSVREGPENMAEQEQIERLKAGDAQAWREAFATYGPRLLGYATRMLGDRSVAEEVVQDSLVAAYKAIGSFEGRAGLKTWLFRVVHNRSIDELRRRKRFVDVPDEEPEPAYFNARGHWAESCPQWADRAEEQLDASRKLVVVRREIDRLPHSYREVLLMKEIHGLETSEICEALEISPGNLRIRLHRARKALRAAVVHGQKES
jgi:RNA polymerase sigma-70 factor (ECF subfamily)